MRIFVLGTSLHDQWFCEVCTEYASHNSKHAVPLHHSLQQLPVSVAAFNLVVLAGERHSAHDDCRADAATMDQHLRLLLTCQLPPMQDLHKQSLYQAQLFQGNHRTIRLASGQETGCCFHDRQTVIGALIGMGLSRTHQELPSTASLRCATVSSCVCCWLQHLTP